ncbi:MAG: TVP38/TMEM64 family protein [Rhodocyclales bacterium]|nr:TVP38/TMEM64 family protein [Rhodocyclales bacterium]
MRSAFLLIPTGVLLTVVAWFAHGGGLPDLGQAIARIDEIVRLHHTHPLEAFCLLFCLQALMAAFAVPGSSLLLLAAGAAYGLLGGTLLCLTACTLGAVLTMLGSRHFLRTAVSMRHGDRLRELDAGIARDGAFYLFSMRMLPMIPFVVVNLAAGLTGMRLWTFAWVSFAGMFASTLVYVHAGVELARVGSVQGLLSPGLLLAFAAIGVLPLASRKVLERRGAFALAGGRGR